MKGLIICSVYALCDISKFERAAYRDACQRHGVRASLTVRDHASLLAQSNMLAFLHRLPGPQRERRVLIESYLEILNDHLWSASIPVYESVFSALLDPFEYARPRSFLSDYPMLTTNLVRSSTLLTNATRLGCLTVPSDPRGRNAPLMGSAPRRLLLASHTKTSKFWSRISETLMRLVPSA